MKPVPPAASPYAAFRVLSLALLAAAAMTACTGAEPPARPAVATAAVAPAEAEIYDAAPPARAPRPVEVVDPQDEVAWALPAPGDLDFQGFGSAAFGATREELRAAWTGNLSRLEPDEAGGCHYLFPEPRRVGGGYGIGFMVEGDRFVRADVDMPGIAAPGGGEVDMSVERIRSMYGERIQERPHKYVQGGLYLQVPAAAGESVLVFEADADGRIQEWRLGVPPQVEYVEGCS
ncbi:MAG: hypothetical protein M3Q40_01115 [Pseudomonadota bacterium]|nr:hypothetical protein [Pseudomonadota bacterium]